MANQTVKQQAIIEEKKAEKQKDEELNVSMLSGIINDDTRTYTFQKIYEVNGQKLKGTFVSKYMSLTDRLRIGVIRAKLLDGAPSDSVDPLADDIAYMISYLQVALISAPRWWNYEELSFEDDLIKLREVYLEVYEFNKSFRKLNEQQSNAGFGKDTSSEEFVED